ncbi:ARM repeat-containing protein [Dendrothele bispora CBS 962.96]|uniref:ARM repeat-containing protein n=1 Tax=Dendrothele bispora (strain CBS 962.96) TaxID=1314807 RepID=A0A4V4HI92_DENBC|nr:ARM repeat-containing protein [Dendrothele bispora CBS 962.96]
MSDAVLNAFEDHRPQQSGGGTASSIWAPQPQPSETTWPKTLDSFSRVAERDGQQPTLAMRPELQHHSSMPGPVTREDVFGPVNDARAPSKEVGAVGDGRKRVTPDSFDSTHVEQLFRTLDLNSPGPYHLNQKPSLNLSFESSNGSPDFSPVSISSALLTPTDLSPSRSASDHNFKPHLQSPYAELLAARGPPGFMTHPSLLFEPDSPTRPGQSLYTNTVVPSTLGTPLGNFEQQPGALGCGSFKTFSEQSSPTSNAPMLPPPVSYPIYHSQSAPLPSYPLNMSPTASTTGPRRSDGAAFDRTAASSATNLSSAGLGGGDWHIPLQVLSQGLLQQQQNLGMQLQQQMNVSATSDWIRPDELTKSTLGQNTVLMSSPLSATAGVGTGLGLGLGLGPRLGAGLEDSIHAPSSLRSSNNTNVSSTGFSSQPQLELYVQSQQQNAQQRHQLSQSQSQQQQRQHERNPSASPATHHTQSSNVGPSSPGGHEPINFLSLLHPSSSPPYHSFVSRIIKSSDQQASIFLQQKLKVADGAERNKIVDAICARGFEMMAHRFGNWAVQRCLEAASSAEERKKIISCMRGRIVELATNCYGCHVLQKALDCEEDIRLLIVSELLLGDPAQTLVNKHASHVWSKIMELSWTAPAPPIFSYVNKSLKGKWAALACHETGSLVVQHAFENLEDSAKDGIVDELLNQGLAVFSEVAKNQWGSYCIQHILEHGSEKHRQMTLDHLIGGLLEFATNEQGYKSITKALKEDGKDMLDRVIKRMCEPAKSSRRAMIVDLALSVTGSQLIASVLPTADKDQRALLYECIRGHIVTLRGCKTGSKVIWLFDRMRAYYGY